MRRLSHTPLLIGLGLVLGACPGAGPSAEGADGQTVTTNSANTETGPPATSSTSDGTETETSTETETGETSTETETGEPGACVSDEDCSDLDDPFSCGFGECNEDGVCVYAPVPDHTSCALPWNNDCLIECIEGVCSPLPDTDPCGHLTHGCRVGFCGNGFCQSNECNEYDEVADFELLIRRNHFPIPQGIFIGAELQLDSYHNDFSCEGCDRFDVVRSLDDDGELVLVSLFGLSFSQAFGPAYFDAPFADIFDPIVSVEHIQPGLCDPVELQSYPDCFVTRQAVDFEHQDGEVLTLLDRTHAQVEGYGISSSDSISFEGPCGEAAQTYYRSYIARLGCDGPCPPPAAADSCVDPTFDYYGDQDTAAVFVIDPDHQQHEGWRSECRVLDIVESEQGWYDLEVLLDCVDLLVFGDEGGPPQPPP